MAINDPIKSNQSTSCLYFLTQARAAADFFHLEPIGVNLITAIEFSLYSL